MLINHCRGLVAALFLCSGLAAQPGAALPLISEVYYDATGSDNGLSFVELYGAPGASVDGFLLEGVNGSNGAITPSVTLSGLIPADGLLVVADDQGDGTSLVANADLILNFDFQNGPDSIVLRDALGVLDAVGYGVFAVACSRISTATTTSSTSPSRRRRRAARRSRACPSRRPRCCWPAACWAWHTPAVPAHTLSESLRRREPIPLPSAAPEPRRAEWCVGAPLRRRPRPGRSLPLVGEADRLPPRPWTSTASIARSCGDFGGGGCGASSARSDPVPRRRSST
jgi:hypothetical protein